LNSKRVIYTKYTISYINTTSGESEIGSIFIYNKRLENSLIKLEHILWLFRWLHSYKSIFSHVLYNKIFHQKQITYSVISFIDAVAILAWVSTHYDVSIITKSQNSVLLLMYSHCYTMHECMSSIFFPTQKLAQCMYRYNTKTKIPLNNEQIPK
jgi:hypothetical protein